MKRILIVMAAALLAGTTAVAQTPQGRGDATKDLTTCPPAQAGQTTPSADAKAVEKSAILPAAEGHTSSAAPTVQRDGKAVEARADCPQDAQQPKPKG